MKSNFIKGTTLSRFSWHKLMACALLLLFFAGGSVSAQSYWRKSGNSARRAAVGEQPKESTHQYFRLDKAAFGRAISAAAAQGSTSRPSTATIQIPDADGILVSYRITPTQVLSAEMAKENPAIQTFAGQAVDNPNKHISLVWSPSGLSGTMVENFSYSFIDAEDKNGEFYKVYHRKDSKGTVEPCKTPHVTPTPKAAPAEVPDEAAPRSPHARPSYVTLNRSYTLRLAIGCTSSFTAAAGGTKSQAYEEVVKTVNRINMIYGAQMSIKFVLVSGTQMIYDNPATDPTRDFKIGTRDWDNENESIKLQNLFDSTFGNANFDVGHLFSKGGNSGNAAEVKAIWWNDWKGRAYSFRSFEGDRDRFDVDVVAHEIGHQVGARHTHSYYPEKETQAFYTNLSQMEPGSASTIMGYAGLAGANNVQTYSDPYFHHRSVWEITQALWAVRNRVSLTNHNNARPDFDDSLFKDYTIPKGTAFVLQGVATDTANDKLLYTWEQSDDYNTAYSNGAWVPAYRFSSTNTTGAIARSLPPSENSTRYIPRLSRIVAGNVTGTTDWETVPTVGRVMHWSLVVTDRPFIADQIGITAYKTITVTVANDAGPFAVTSHSQTTNWIIGNTVTLTWDVANTNIAPVNTDKVDILFSTDGGQTFSYTLAEAVPNNGTAVVTATTSLTTTQGRYMIKANGNIFLAVNRGNITVSEQTTPPTPPTPQTPTLPDGPILMSNAFTPNNDGVNDTYVIARSENFPNNTLQVYNTQGQLVYEAKGYKNQWDGTMSNGERVARGSYIAIFSKDGSDANKQRTWVYINY